MTNLNLKTGDTAYVSLGGRAYAVREAKVTEVTPSGRVTVQRGEGFEQVFNPDGWERSTTSINYRARLVTEADFRNYQKFEASRKATSAAEKAIDSLIDLSVTSEDMLAAIDRVRQLVVEAQVAQSELVSK